MTPRAALSFALLASCASPAASGDASVDVAALDRGAADVSVDATASDVSAAPACASCTTYALEAGNPRVASAELDELSGIVESRRTPGVFFAHNDSGDTARFFAIDARGRLLAEYALDGATAVDWEDVASAPCGAEQCLYFADIGDNNLARSDYAVYRVREPEAPASPPATVRPVDVPWERLPFRYPDGAHNAETLLAHGATGDLYVVTKVETGSSGVYRFPAASQGVTETTLTRVATLDLPASGAVLVTGGSLHPCEPRLLIRTYVRLFEYVLPEGRPLEAIFTATAREMPFRAERQGEAVGWRTNGRGYVTVSEGNGPPLNLFGCEQP